MVTGNKSSVLLLSEGDEGDHIMEVATRAGTIVAGRNAEFERDRDRLLSLGLGLGETGPWSVMPGVEGRR